MKHVLRSTFILLVPLLFVAACAGPAGVVKNASPAAISKSLSLDFILVQTSSSLPAMTTEKQALSDAIMSGLNESGLFKTVTQNSSDPRPGYGIQVQADIREIKRVSPDARVWRGAGAGRARILAQVTVTDLPTGKLIESFQAEGQSGKSAFAGTTDEAIDMAASQIVAEVVQINAQTAQ